MKEYNSSNFKHALSIHRYQRDTQGNVVAAFLTEIFNNACRDKGMVSVHTGTG
jgi:hypothetical protein